jgi:beta-glucosidase
MPVYCTRRLVAQGTALTFVRLLYSSLEEREKTMFEEHIYKAPLPLYLPLALKGSATASHQVHGSPNSNWDNFERSKKRTDELLAMGKDPKDFIAGHACEFESRYYSDFRLAQTIGHNAIRFSINWATVEPNQGKFDTGVLANYQRMVERAIDSGLEPVITLYHWTHPAWFEQMGGWKHPDAPSLFGRFVAETLKFIGSQVRWYTVLNEPNCYSTFGYRWGIWPPQEQNEEVYTLVVRHLAAAHRQAYALIKRQKPYAEVGIGQAVGWQTTNNPAKRKESDEWNYGFVDALKPYLDFIGLQLYFHFDDKASGLEGKDACTDHPVVSDIGWAMCPRALYEVLKEFATRYPGVRLMVTEHGHADRDMDDNRRCWYIWESLKWLSKGIDEGVPLIGYLHWSLLRNFEWAYGWDPDFGLIHVDLVSQKRTVRTSALLLRDIYNAGALTEEIAKKYAHVIKHPHSAWIA